MSGARVESLDALKAFRLALFKFSEAANVALGDAESEIHRTLMWLETEQLSYWQGQIRKRTEMLARAQDALRQKTLYKDAAGRQQSAVDEMKVVAQWKARLDIATQKLANVKVYTRRLQKEMENYKGTVQRFATAIQSDVPLYAARLERMVGTLQAYTELTPDDVSAAGSAAFSGELARSAAQAAGYGAAVPAAADEVVLTDGELAALRKQTPFANQLADAPPGILPTAGRGTRRLNAIDLESLAALSLERDLPADSSRIIVRRGSIETPTIYLERARVSGDGDSGWYLGPVIQLSSRDERSEPQLFASRVSDLLAIRPDLQPVLKLPRGSLVVLAASSVVAVLDLQDQNVWKVLTQVQRSGHQLPEASELPGEQVDP